VETLVELLGARDSDRTSLPAELAAERAAAQAQLKPAPDTSAAVAAGEPRKVIPLVAGPERFNPRREVGFERLSDEEKKRLNLT
jgi:hypothetical protein